MRHLVSFPPLLLNALLLLCIPLHAFVLEQPRSASGKPRWASVDTSRSLVVTRASKVSAESEQPAANSVVNSSNKRIRKREKILALFKKEARKSRENALITDSRDPWFADLESSTAVAETESTTNITQSNVSQSNVTQSDETQSTEIDITHYAEALEAKLKAIEEKIDFMRNLSEELEEASSLRGGLPVDRPDAFVAKPPRDGISLSPRTATVNPSPTRQLHLPSLPEDRIDTSLNSPTTGLGSLHERVSGDRQQFCPPRSLSIDRPDILLPKSSRPELSKQSLTSKQLPASRRSHAVAEATVAPKEPSPVSIPLVGQDDMLLARSPRTKSGSMQAPMVRKKVDCSASLSVDTPAAFKLGPDWKK